MTYTIRKSNGSLLIDLDVGTTDFTKSSIALIGKNTSDFGKNQNENFVHMLENFANTFGPNQPLDGQLWFDTAAQQLNVKTSTGYKTIGPFAAPSTAGVSDNSTALATTAFVHSVLPKGSIILWYGAISTIPSGWALCNGQVVAGITTPDLTARFVMGGGTSLPRGSQPGYVAYPPGSMGGTAAISAVPAHSHSFSTTSENNNQDHTHGGVTAGSGTHTHVMPGDDQLGNAAGLAGFQGQSEGSWRYDATSQLGGGGQMWRTSPSGSHNHSFNTGNQNQAHQHEVAGNTSQVGTPTVDVLNPYYALAYIMKTV